MAEFRLYYDDQGKVLFYTGEKPEGNFIVIDSSAFAEARMDVKVIDGVIVSPHEFNIIHKLKPSQSGTLTHKEDVCLILDAGSDGQYWDLDSFTARK